jgi:hypothetical protein
MGTKRIDGPGVLGQLIEAGVGDYIAPGSVKINAHSIEGALDLDVLEKLRDHHQFQEGIFHGLHEDVGEHRTEFRSHLGSFGDGSLQLVIDWHTGRFYADVDKFSPYSDVVGIFGHLFGEVVANKIRRWFGREERIARLEDHMGEIKTAFNRRGTKIDVREFKERG